METTNLYKNSFSELGINESEEVQKISRRMVSDDDEDVDTLIVERETSFLFTRYDRQGNFTICMLQSRSAPSTNFGSNLVTGVAKRHPEEDPVDRERAGKRISFARAVKRLLRKMN